MPSTLGIVASGVAATTPTSIAAYRSDASNYVDDTGGAVPGTLSITQSDLTSGGGAPVSGDIVLLAAASYYDIKIGGAYLNTTPTGFTNVNSSSGGGTAMAVWRKTATASEGTYSVSVASATGLYAFGVFCLVVKDAVAYDAQAIRNGTATIYTPTSLVTTANSAFLCHFVTRYYNSTDFTVGSPLTDAGSMGSGGYFFMHPAYETGGTAGTQTVRTVYSTGVGQPWDVISVAVQ